MIASFIKQATLALIFCALTYAGGSISWQDAKEVIKKSDPVCLNVLEKHFTLADTGNALRLGKHHGADAGKRIPPYTFEATRKSDGKKCIIEIAYSIDSQFTNRFAFSVEEIVEKK